MSCLVKSKCIAPSSSCRRNQWCVRGRASRNTSIAPSHSGHPRLKQTQGMQHQTPCCNPCISTTCRVHVSQDHSFVPLHRCLTDQWPPLMHPARAHVLLATLVLLQGKPCTAGFHPCTAGSHPLYCWASPSYCWATLASTAGTSFSCPQHPWHHAPPAARTAPKVRQGAAALHGRCRVAGSQRQRSGLQLLQHSAASGGCTWRRRRPAC